MNLRPPYVVVVYIVDSRVVSAAVYCLAVCGKKTVSSERRAEGAGTVECRPEVRRPPSRTAVPCINMYSPRILRLVFIL